jgi:hypothetical protein
MVNRFFGLFFFVIAFVGFAWLSAGVSLLDDDWGHLKLAANGVGFILTTGWEGLIGQGGYYRPIVVLSFYLNYLIGGFDPAGYHVLNVLIHAGCAGLVFVLGRQLGLLDWVCWGSAGLFFVLPIHTDSVFWIVGRTDTVCALFYLGSMIAFLKLLEEWSVWKLMFLIVCAGLAFLSKEMALSLPGVLLVLAWYRNRLMAKSGVLGVGAVVIVLLIYFVVRWVVLGGIFGGTPSIRFSVVRWGVDLAKSFAKFGMTDLKWFGGVVLVITGGLFFGDFRKNRRWVRSLPLMLTMVCVVSLVPVLGHLHNWYLYIPSAFFCLVVADIWMRQSGHIFSFLFVGLLLYYTGVMIREGVIWRDASRVSEGFVADVLPYAQTTHGRLFVLNTPSAWTPPKSIGGKPLFAFALKNAVSMRSAQPISADIVMVNHVWLTGDMTCVVEPQENLFQIQIVDGGYFSFHGGKEALQPPFLLEQEWGHLNVLSEYLMSVMIDLKFDDRIVFFDGERLKTF